MIKICGNYYMTANSYNYIVKKAYRKKDGEMGYSYNILYYSSLFEALNTIKQYAIRDGIAEEKLTDLKQMISELERTATELKNAVAKLSLDLNTDEIKERIGKMKDSPCPAEGVTDILA